jgi:type IV pilus assembly protein PilZ
MAENREHPRAPIELRVDYRRLNSFFADYTRNISKGGTFIKTSRALPVGTRFHFQLSIPVREQPLQIAGEVVHSGGEVAGMGIRFVWGSDEERRAFESLVEQLMAESLGADVARNLLKHTR